MAFYSIFEVGNGGREQPRPLFTLKRPHPFPKGKVVRLACQPPSCFVYATGRKQTNYATDKPRERLFP